jgi:uncharacterized protein (TIGR02284 family)
MADHNAVATLNGLIATLLDSVEGYRSAAGDVDSTRYASLFTARADERQQCVLALQSAVRAAGGTPDDHGTLLAGAHRAFMNLKAMVATRDDAAIITEVERGEDHLKAKFEDALKITGLAPSALAAIAGVWDSVKSGHDQMRDLKNATQA